MELNKLTRDWLLDLHNTKRITLEGNILKVIKADDGDEEFKKYLSDALEKDKETRRKRLEITKQVQERNRELSASGEEIKRINDELKEALEEAEEAKHEALQAKDEALNDLDLIQKRSQFELIGTIVKVALFIILGVGLITTIMYGIAMLTGKDTQIIGSTWSNMFGILLTNAFSIIGTIMGVKYASEKPKNE
ncbi:GLE1-like [uncultured Caudovirales phage]|uniref:GLE1-like n=1 Tax=uncultured Caudovirales phage TaxID=2100421 RepID=A0A6J5NHY8_9CAUD|nr:GLE1-like [uncultured Caudovirales phage]